MSALLPAAASRLVGERPDLVARVLSTTDLLDEGSTGAVFPRGDDPVYRYMLWRIWNAALPLMVAVILNPSTADHEADDRTISGLAARARDLGMGGVLVVNLFALRAREPDDMKRHADPVGPANDAAIEAALASPHAMLLCAWGADGIHLGRETEFACVLSRHGIEAHALRTCANGSPGHPLYVPRAVAPTPWRPPSGAAATPTIPS